MAMSQLMLEPALCIRHPSLEKTTIESAASLVSHIPGVQSVTSCDNNWVAVAAVTIYDKHWAGMVLCAKRFPATAGT